jgi:hypothetical protein
MHKLKVLLSKVTPWLRQHAVNLVCLLVYLLVAGFAVVIIGTNRSRMLDAFAMHPYITAIAMLLACIFGWLLFAHPNFLTKALQGSKDAVLIGFIVIVALSGGIYLISGAETYSDEAHRGVALSAAAGWGLAYLSLGFVVGFLFGIPRVLQANTDLVPPNGDGRAEPARYEQRVNTNLEQISDWLTKIIVGLGLVELRSTPARVAKAAAWMARSLSNNRGADFDQIASFCCAFIIFFGILGFLAGYLLTRLFLAGAFWRADRQPTTVLPDVPYTPSDDPNAGFIRSYWKPGNKIEPAADEAVKDWLRRNRVDASVPLFISGEQFRTKRAEIVKDLNLIKRP